MNNKKLLALLLVGGLGLTGCGNGAQTSETVDNAETRVEDTAENVGDAVTDTADEIKDDADDLVDDDVAENTPAMDTEGTPAEEDTELNTIPQITVSLEDAVKSFHEAFGDTDINILSVELDQDDGFYKYNIEGYKDGMEYEADIDANTNEVIKSESDTDDDMYNVFIDFNEIITPEEAMEAALEGQDGAYVVEWELSVDDGRVKYEIDVENGSDKEVDALTGEVYND